MFNGELSIRNIEKYFNLGEYTKVANIRNKAQSLKPTENTLAYIIPDTINFENKFE